MLEGGARVALAEGVTVGAQLAYEAGPLDENPGASAGLQLEATGRIGPAPVNGLLRARQQLDADRGAALDARVNLGVYGGHGLRVGVFGQATWASDDHLQAYYGVVEDGLFFASGGAFGTYDLTARWALMGSAELRRLGGTPAASGVVADRSNEFVSLGVAYRF